MDTTLTNASKAGLCVIASTLMYGVVSLFALFMLQSSESDASDNGAFALILIGNFLFPLMIALSVIAFVVLVALEYAKPHKIYGLNLLIQIPAAIISLGAFYILALASF